MVEKHEGWEERGHTFDEASEALDAAGRQELMTRAGTPFAAGAAITKRGKRTGERAIRYFQGGPGVWSVLRVLLGALLQLQPHSNRHVLEGCG